MVDFKIMPEYDQEIARRGRKAELGVAVKE